MHPSTLYDPNSPWIIALTTAANTLFVYHLLVHKDFSVMSLGEPLIDEGIRFHTLQLLPHLSVKSNISTVCSLIPICVKDYKFNLHDYHAYIPEQARILFSPQEHAALLEGGLIGDCKRTSGPSFCSTQAIFCGHQSLPRISFHGYS